MVRFNWKKMGYFQDFFKLKFRITANNTATTYECDRNPFTRTIDRDGSNYTFEWILEHDGRPHTGPNPPIACVQIDNIEMQGLQFEDPTSIKPGRTEAIIEEPRADPPEGSILDSYSLIAKTKNIQREAGMNLEIINSRTGKWDKISTAWPNESNIVKFDNINFKSWGEKRCKISCGKVSSPDVTILISSPVIAPESGSNITSYKFIIESRNDSLDKRISLQIWDNDGSEWMSFGLSSRDADNITFNVPDLKFIRSLTLGMYPRCRFKIGERETEDFEGPRIDSLIWIHRDSELIVEAIREMCNSPICITDNNETIQRNYTDCGKWQIFRFPEINFSDCSGDIKVSTCND